MFTFSKTIYEVLWEALGLPPMPATITVTQSGATLEERNRVRGLTLNEVGRLGLGRPPNLDPRLTDLFDVLGRHERAISLRELAGYRRRAYAAASGRHGALAVIQGEQVTMVAISGDHVASELLTLLSPLPAGQGRAVSLPANIFAAAMKAYADPADSSEPRGILSNAGISGKDIERLLTISKSAVCSGSIGVHNDKYGSVKLVGSLGYTDTPQGRYLILQRADQVGQPHTSIIPADLNSIGRRIHELLGLNTGW